MSLILDDVLEEHAEEAAFLWQQREAAVRAPDFDIEELTEADERLEAHLDGLRIGGERSWEINTELGWDLPGEYFTAMSIAIMLARQDLVTEVLEEAEGDQEAAKGIISALGWVEPKQLRGLVNNLLRSDSSYQQMIGIGACAIHRTHPKIHLTNALQSNNEVLLARALKATGELGDIESLPLVQAHIEHEDDICRFQAARSAVLLGDRSALRILSLYAGTQNPNQRKAMDVVLRAMEPAAAQQWIKELAADKSQLRYALIASGIQGDPVYLPALMRQFENEEVALVAGEAFEMITGLNMFRESLEVIPEHPVASASEETDVAELSDDIGEEDDDDDEDLGEDTGLVMPDMEKMIPWFAENKDRFQVGQRYLCGQPITPESCTGILATGQQRQRKAAALELVLAQPGSVLFETRAQGRRQWRLLLAGQN